MPPGQLELPTDQGDRAQMLATGAVLREREGQHWMARVDPDGSFTPDPMASHRSVGEHASYCPLNLRDDARVARVQDDDQARRAFRSNIEAAIS
jgi:hypothetical protein